MVIQYVMCNVSNACFCAQRRRWERVSCPCPDLVIRRISPVLTVRHSGGSRNPDIFNNFVQFRTQACAGVTCIRMSFYRRWSCCVSLIEDTNPSSRNGSLRNRKAGRRRAPHLSRCTRKPNRRNNQSLWWPPSDREPADKALHAASPRHWRT